MAFDLSGYVLKSPRSAPSNATTTGPADDGVARNHADLPGSYVVPGDTVEVPADQYRAAVLDNPQIATQEYLVWAANTSNLAIVEDPTWAITQGTGSIPTGSLTVVSGSGSVGDGTDRVIVTDDADRSIAEVLAMLVVRGDTLVPVSATFASQDMDAGLVVLDGPTLLALGGGVSQSRGDRVALVSYVLAAQRFWWTRNDADMRRFGWDGITQRWRRFKGGSPATVGVLLPDTTYTLVPRPDRFAIGDGLPYDPSTGDAYAMVRIGRRPDAEATPVVVQVVADADAASESVSVPPGFDGVIGITSGLLRFDPAYVTAHAGQTVFYSPEVYTETSDGVLRDLKGAIDDPPFLAPIPEITERPFIRLGSRSPLRPIAVETEVDLASLAVAPGEVGWARSTGRLKLSQVDVDRADPDALGFDLLYLGAVIVFDGVALSQKSVPTRQPVQMVDSSGTATVVDGGKDLFAPLATDLPSPGRSGVFLVPDGTGMTPNTGTPPSTRPNGSGLVREIRGQAGGDIILFGRQGALDSVAVVEYERDLTALAFKVRSGEGQIAREEGTAGSKVVIGAKDRKRFAGEPLYLLQAEVQPLTYASSARLISRVREPFRLDGTEVLAFAVDGVAYLWSASSLGAGSYTAAQVAASLDVLITGTGRAVARTGRIWLEAGNISTGSVEIGFGSILSGAFVDRDLSGCAALGFLPGWRVADPASSDNWLPDSGVSVGVVRSPRNLDRSQAIADHKAVGRFRDTVLADSVIGNPVFTLNNPPLLDVAGYDTGVFLSVVDGIYRRTLGAFRDVLYDCEHSRFSWLDEGSISASIQAPTTSIPLGNPGVVDLTLHPAVGAGYGLYMALTGGVRSLLTLNEDYVLPDDGAQGLANLVEVVGARIATGARGAFTSGGTNFTDPDATFITDGVSVGYRLEVLGGPVGARGSYIVANVVSETTLSVDGDIPFPETGSPVSWEIHGGFPDTVFDPGLLADVVYSDFDHLPDEPFVVRLLSGLGEVPADVLSQASGRLHAIVSDAIAHGRPVEIRFGAEPDATTAALEVLGLSVLGTVANGTLRVPDVADPHFTEAAFSIRVGSVSYTQGSNLVGVSVFTEPLTGDQVEYGLPSSGIEGQIKFGTGTLTDLAASKVAYVEEFRDPVDLPAGSAEIDPATGELNLSAIDLSTHAGEPAYFVERAITRNRLDVVISPLQGSIFFQKPLRAGQIVEVDYFQADVAGGAAVDPDGNPIRIVEKLPVAIRQETATEVDPITFAFNGVGRTVTAVEPTVWVNRRLKNYGNTRDFSFAPESSEIRFSAAVAGAFVQITYFVLEATGGERSYTVSTPPVYRPPFFLAAGAGQFTLETDRTAELVPGVLLVVGGVPSYIEASSFAQGVTTVTIFPTPDTEIGSRAPGNDVMTLLSSRPVTTEVDGVPTSGSPGFLLPLGASYDPADLGMLSLTFAGDVTQFATAGHLLEIGGQPHLVAGSSLSDDGLNTVVTLTSPLRRGFDPTVDMVKLSVRPIYGPDASEFVGLGGVVSTDPIAVILFGETDPSGAPRPGRTLVQGVDYELVEGTGGVRFLDPPQGPLLPGQRLFISYTRLRTVQPYLSGRTVVTPTYGATYAYVTPPTETNGFLGATLVGRYTFDSPDSFYVRAVPVVDYLGEVGRIAANRVSSRTPHGGPVVVGAPSGDLWTYGTVPLLADRRELLDQDRAARVFISVYDSVIGAFEQVSETIEGEVIGDRDGKFRFFVGRGRVYAAPGYEDGITGILTPRNVWSHVFQAATGDFGVTVLDPIVDPATAAQDPLTLEVTGDPMGPWLLDFYVRKQRDMVRNDMDDVVLAGKGHVRLIFPFDFKVFGDFRGMWQPSVVSRLFPERALAFTTTYPGIGAGLLPGDPGVYSFLKRIKVDAALTEFTSQAAMIQSTFGMDIGSIENPAFGPITGITGDTKVKQRLPRARIWAYSPTGFADLDPASDGRPSVIATPLALKDLPLDPDTGLPQVSRLVSGGGDLPDLSTGDIALSTPSWYGVDSDADVLPQLAFGVPDGSTYSVGLASGTLSSAFSGGITFTPVPKGLFVGEILGGCIITFADQDGTPITDAADIVVVGADGVTLPFSPTKGDTIYVINPDSVDASALDDPPKEKDVKKFFKNQPFLDVGVRERSSTFVDRSLPSWDDPNFGIKEIVRQRTAAPLMTVEAEVQFANTARDPFEFPALLGLPTNDSGDYGIPYLSATNTELDRLGAVQGAFAAVTQSDTPAPAAAYPDEIVGNDGTILGAFASPDPPATLLTSRDLTPVTTAGSYTPHSGIGDVAPYDLLLVQVGQAGIGAGATGILSVGAVASDRVEPPRFVTATQAGDRIRYLLANAMVHLSSSGLTGMTVSQVGPDTILDITSIGGLFFNDGSGATLGGLNDLFGNVGFPFPNDNVVTIQLIDQGSGLVVETIVLEGASATGAAGTAVLATPPLAAQKTITVPGLAFVANLGTLFDFTVSVNTYNAAAVAAGSVTGYVDTDRLTFVETLDLRTMLPRGAVTTGGVPVAGKLRVARVTASGVDDCSVNAAPEVNAGADFTFLDRDGSGVVGTFDPSPGTGLGSVRVPAFEGQGNSPLVSTAPVTFSAVPSSGQDEVGDILKGTGTSPDGSASIRAVVPSTGTVAGVEPGDVLAILRSASGDAAVKAGTYLVRHVVSESNPILSVADTHEVLAATSAGSGSGWVGAPFPVVLATAAGPLLTVSGIQTVPGSPSGYDFATTGRLYVVKDPIDASVSIAYTAFVVLGDGSVRFTLTAGSGQTSSGAALSDVDFLAQVAPGDRVSGMVFLPIQQFGGLPPNNVVGFGTSTAGGFTDITFGNGSGTPVSWAFGVDLIDSTGAVPPAGEIGVWVSDVPGGTYTADPGIFVSDLRTPVYSGVPLFLDLRGITATQWDTLHGTSLSVDCLVPGDLLSTDDGAGNPGFLAQAGVFLEPSWPRPAIDIGGADPLVVDAAHSLTTAQVGLRDAAAFGLGSSEAVYFEVRRIRRFHAVMDAVGANLTPLRYAYEIRRGTVASYTPSTRLFVATGAGTQLGSFASVDVNIHAGDEVRILDASGVVVDRAEIASVIDGTTLRLRVPGFSENPPVGGESFQVYLRRAPVPHEQSHEQLLELVTETVVFSSQADPVTGDGGRVDTTNQLKDPSVADFTTLGLQVGDILLVDPAGVLAGATGAAVPPEVGSRPIGDQAVVERGPGAPYIAGGPSPLDDNRGWYRIASLTPTAVTVTGASEFTGPDGTSNVVFGAATQEFTVLPTIHGSGLTGGVEGQMDLRPTAPAGASSADPNSYLGNFSSIEPFSYRIIRPSPLLQDESIDLVLLMRERLSSWLEELSNSLDGGKGGSYYVFQRDEHISDLGSATDPGAGLGVVSNLFTTSLSGLTQYAPFANTSDCLSVLDRRYWCLDLRLDAEVPPYGGVDPYASFEADNSVSGFTIGSGRPVLPDRIDDVLDRTDRLRELRYSWIRFRTDTVDGTLPAVIRFDTELPRRLREQEDLLRLQESFDST